MYGLTTGYNIHRKYRNLLEREKTRCFLHRFSQKSIQSKSVKCLGISWHILVLFDEVDIKTCVIISAFF